MQVKHLSDAKPYEAPNHRGYCSLRLFGLDAGGPKQFTVGVSHFLPGGGAGPDASPTEKVYYVLAGELTLIAGGKPCSRPTTPASSGRMNAARSSIAATTS